jgi:glycosyltransferase involved in cell wall biosynthesis
MTAVKISKNKSIPAFCALGEGNIKYYEEHMGLDKVKYIANNLAGIISVSRDNVDYCQSRLGIPSEKILFAPNAADTEIFFKRDKAEARKELSIPNDMNLIIFTGHFDNNKGALRVYKALEKCKNVYGAFLGSGSDNPEGEKVFFCGRVEHEKIPTWLSAADIFILPTIREASSNSVAEAAACGLPIITSDIPSMHDMTTDEFAIKVNAESVEKITDAIKMLISDKEKRNNFSSSALEHAKNYNLKTRAEKILNWITSKLKEKE